MTVKKLIDELTKCHPEAEVYMNLDESDALLTVADSVTETWDDSEEGKYLKNRGKTQWLVYIDSEGVNIKK